MTQRLSLAFFGAIGLLASALAASAIWSSGVEPVATAAGLAAARHGDPLPLLNLAAHALYDLLTTLLGYM